MPPLSSTIYIEREEKKLNYSVEFIDRNSQCEYGWVLRKLVHFAKNAT